MNIPKFIFLFSIGLFIVLVLYDLVTSTKLYIISNIIITLLAAGVMAIFLWLAHKGGIL